MSVRLPDLSASLPASCSGEGSPMVAAHALAEGGREKCERGRKVREEIGVGTLWQFAVILINCKCSPFLGKRA